MIKKNFTILGMSYDDYLDMKYKMLRETVNRINEQERMENLKDILDNDPLK